jgi:hypothetical protein
MYFAALAKAGFDVPPGFAVQLHIRRELREELAKDSRLKHAAIPEDARSAKDVAASSPSLFGSEDLGGHATASADPGTWADSEDEAPVGALRTDKRSPAIKDVRTYSPAGR